MKVKKEGEFTATFSPLSSDLKVPIMRLVYNDKKKPRLLYEFFFFSIY